MAQRHCYELAAPAKVVEVLELKSQRRLFNLHLETRCFYMFVNRNNDETRKRLLLEIAWL